MALPIDWIRPFEQHGLKFVSLCDSIGASDCIGRVMLCILGMVAEPERATTAERVAEDLKLRCFTDLR